MKQSAGGFTSYPYVTIHPAPRPRFADQLADEWPAILSWMIEGCLEWQSIGLGPPDVVLNATAAYLNAQDATEPGWRNAAKSIQRLRGQNRPLCIVERLGNRFR